jgi:hypothetical protein
MNDRLIFRGLLPGLYTVAVAFYISSLASAILIAKSLYRI